MKWQGAHATSQTTELGGESLIERLFFFSIRCSFHSRLVYGPQIKKNNKVFTSFTSGL